MHKKELLRYGEMDNKGPRKTLYLKAINAQNDCILNVVPKNELELNEIFTDKWPFLELRRNFFRTQIYIKIFASNIINHTVFDRICIFVIMANSFTLALEDPQAVSTTKTADAIENVFLALYTIEMVLKIVGMGFVSGKDAYLKDPWNILDFTIVSSAYLTVIQDVTAIIQNGGVKPEVTAENVDNGGLSLNSLRAFRVLRPLRAVTSIKGLQVLVVSVLSALPLLRDTMMVLMAFFLVFAIAGTQLLSGVLKNRCVKIEDGTDFDSEYLCGAEGKCPEGYFCGKQNANPNFGVTNFDNLMFSLLVVFQCITLEGWSDVMVDLQKTWTKYSYVLILPIVFIGAFFLINLLLAVIQARFSMEQAKQKAKQEEQLKKSKIIKKKTFTDDNFDEDEVVHEIGVNEFWVGSRFSRSVLQRTRQNIEKRKALERQKGWMDEEIIDDEIIVENKGLTGPAILPKQEDEESQLDFSFEINKLIQSATQETEEEDSKRVKFKVQKKDQTTQIKRFAVSEMEPSHKLQLKKRVRDVRIETVDASQLAVKIPELQQRYEGPLAKKENLEKILAINEENLTEKSAAEKSSFQHPFDLTERHSQRKDLEDFSLGSDKEPTPRGRVKFKPNEMNNSYDIRSSIIASDSSFEHKLEDLEKDMNVVTTKQAGTTEDKKQQDTSQLQLLAQGSQGSISSIETLGGETKVNKPKKRRRRLNAKITDNPDQKYKKFKTIVSSVDPIWLSQTKSKDPYEYIPAKSHKIEILAGYPYRSTSTQDVFEMRNELADYKQFQDACRFVKADLPLRYRDLEAENRFESKPMVDKYLDWYPTEKEELEEDPSKKAKVTFAQKMDKMFPRGDIRNGVPERGLSLEYLRFLNGKFSAWWEAQMPKPQEFVIPKAYQMKSVYRTFQEEMVEFDDDDDDAIILALQPYDTARSVGYGHLLTHKPIKFVTRRSDIIVSSTLQLTLTPADCGYKPLDHALMPREQIEEWCDLRCIYQAMCTEQPQNPATFGQKPADTFFGEQKTVNLDNETPFAPKKSFKPNSDEEFNEETQRNDFMRKKKPTLVGQKSSLTNKSSTILDATIFAEHHREPKKPKRMIPPTLLREPLPPEKLNLMGEEEKRLYQIQRGKYDTYQRICQKKKDQGEHPKDRKFQLHECNLLLKGLHHEDDDEDDEINIGHEIDMQYLGREEPIKQKLEQFENQIIQRRAKPKQRFNTRPVHEHIPQDVKAEFDIPDQIGSNTVNFDEVLRKDYVKKRKTPFWSGQDVLAIGLTPALALGCVSEINAVRVWPKGLGNQLKKARVLLKMMVKLPIFDSFMTFCVLLNTIAMGMEQYNLDQATSDGLELAGSIFTWIFIFELTAKVAAIGPKKYLQDKMNWLDGSVVMLSVIELLMAAFASGQGGNLSAFRTVRVFRTFRVLRVARLLRALRSMKTILQVIASSASSFVYITMLLFVFIFIYTLLGIQVFGGQMDFLDGKPRGNYDSFIIAFLTVFQVLTTENWNSVLYDSMRSETLGQVAPVIYYVSWIFIGNFILLNLFLAILLDGFVTEDEGDEGDLEQIEKEEREQRMIKIELEKQRRLKKMGCDPKNRDDENQNARKQKMIEENLVDDVDDMEIKTIKEIFMDVGLIKTKDPEREARLLYQGIHCEKSFYIFQKQNPIRLSAYKIQKHKLFDNTIMLLIGLSSVKLALDSYLVYYPPDAPEITLSENIDIVMNILFLMECITKNLAMGMIMDEGSYLRESWNQLDMFIVFTSVLDMSLAGVDIPVIKILRLLRTLRPLRVISHNVAMKLIVNALFESVGAIFNVMVVVVAVWLMFGIFAINIFAGKFFYCSIGTYTYHTKYECNSAGGSWLRTPQNFDDIFQAMLTLFNIASLEGWPDVMVTALDVVDVDQGPQKEKSVINGFFFIIFILIGSFFLMNFFVGVLFMKYTQAAKNEQKGYSNEALCWVDIQKMIIEQRCEFDLMNKPDRELHPQKFKYWRIVTSKPFEFFIMGAIVLNIVQMGINFENAPLLYVKLLEISDYFFTVIFVAECYLKLRAYTFRYFETTSNKFDFFIVVSSIIDIVLSFQGEAQSESLSVGPQIARMMRVMRVTRIVRLASKDPGLQALMQTIQYSVGPISNVFVLLLLVLFIFSILAVFFFGQITSGDVIDEYRNFNDFGQSFLFLFVISTGENWNMLMYDCNITPPNCEPGVNCGTSYAPFFFIVFVLFVQNVMLNLFILVIIMQFETYYISDDNAIKKYKKNQEVFMKTWVDFTATKSRCVRLREKQLFVFFRRLPLPIGLPPETTDQQMKKIMLKMGIKCDDGYIYFNELLYRCMRRLYGSFKLNRKMQIHELKTQYQIYQIKLQAQGHFMMKDPQELFLNKTMGLEKSVNPFLQEMYYKISFNTWLNYARKTSRKIEHEKQQEINKQEQWAKGLEYTYVPFKEEEVQYQHVEIELEEILSFTSDGASTQQEQEDSDQNIQVQTRVLTRSELRTQITRKPFGSQESRGFSQVVKHKRVNVRTEYEILGIGKDMGRSDPTSKLIISRAKNNAKSHHWRDFDKKSPLVGKGLSRFSKTVRIKPMNDLRESKDNMKRMDSMFKESQGADLKRLASN